MRITNFLAAIAGALVLAGSAQADLLITEVVDGTLPGGLPKWVELTNTGATAIDFNTTTYSFGNFSNGGTDLGGGAASVLTGTLAAGSSYVIAYEADNGPTGSAFYGVYTADPDFYMGGAYVNGDDALALFLGAAVGDGTNATILDVYGVIGVDGTGQAWDYIDSFSYRCGDVANAGVFDEADWHFEGPDGLEAGCGGDDTCETGNLLAWTTPWVHAGCGVAEPGFSYCPGDGTGTGCPCANNSAGPGGCDWGNSSFPEGGVLTASGSDSIAAMDTYLHATGVEDNFGIFFEANNQVNGGAGNVLNDGLRCAGGGLVRLTSPTTASGNMADLPAPIQTLGSTAVAGSAKRYQYWFRTPTGPCGQMANLTNGYEILWTL